MTTEQVAASINPWQVAQQQFDLAAERLNLDPGLRRVLREPRRELTVHFPVKMDDGSVQVRDVTAAWDRVGPIVNEEFQRRVLPQTTTRIVPTDRATQPRLRGAVTLMVQQDTKPPLQPGDPAASVLNRVEYGDRT